MFIEYYIIYSESMNLENGVRKFYKRYSTFKHQIM